SRASPFALATNFLIVYPLVFAYDFPVSCHPRPRRQETRMATSFSPSPAPSPAPAKFRIDVAIHDLLMQNPKPPQPPTPQGLTLPEPVFPQRPELLNDPGTDIAPVARKWRANEIYRSMRGWLFPYIRSRVLP